MPVAAPSTTTEPAAGAAIRQSSLWQDAWRRYIRNRAAVAAGIIFILICIYCLAIPGFWKIPGIWTSLKDYDPNAVDFSQSYAGFSLDHPFSTDKFGRDLFARVAQGGQISIAIGFAATFMILVIGILYGSISGFVGGRLDNGMMRSPAALYGPPSPPSAIITTQILTPSGSVSVWTMVVALTIASCFTAA